MLPTSKCFREMHASPVFPHADAAGTRRRELREYQLAGVNWLLYSRANVRVAASCARRVRAALYHLSPPDCVLVCMHVAGAGGGGNSVQRRNVILADEMGYVVSCDSLAWFSWAAAGPA